MKYGSKVLKSISLVLINAHLDFEMADEQDEREGIADFMDMIQDYPSIYNRSSKDFKDKFKKENCWKAVAERVIEPVDAVKKDTRTLGHS